MESTIKRFYFIAFLLLLFSLFIVWRLLRIQFWEGEPYYEQTKSEMTKRFKIQPKRGDLYTEDGSLLATSSVRYNVHFDTRIPKDKVFEDSLESLCDSLGYMFGKPSSYYRKKINHAQVIGNQYLLIGRRLSYSERNRIRKFPIFNLGRARGGLIIENYNERRAFPFGQYAKRTIGYLHKDDKGNTTRVGLEGAFSNYLQGREGVQLKRRISNGHWKPLVNYDHIEPQDGMDVVTTINSNTQDVTHHALLKQLKRYKAQHGCVIVMEVATGQIKAISNMTRVSNGNYYETFNYAIGESHEPGSTFKLMALVAALDDKVIDTNTVVDTKKGAHKFYDRYVHDTRRGGYGKISVSQAFIYSSNVAFSKIIDDRYKNNPEIFVDHLYKMGLNDRLGLPLLGEGKPFIPHPNDKKHWYGTTLPWMAFGYGVSITPLQTLTFYNAIANDGLMIKPTFLKEIKEWKSTKKNFADRIRETRICSKETAAKARELMKNVVNSKYGTGHKLLNSTVSMAGKTGTCQKNYSVLNKNDMQYISSFAGYFPVGVPKYSCIVVIHEPDKSKGYYGADVAGPVFKEIAGKIYTSEVRNVYSISDIDKVSGSVYKDFDRYEKMSDKYISILPNVKGMHAMDAIPLLENMGLKVKVKGKGRIRYQSIKPGKKIKKNETVVLTLL